MSKPTELGLTHPQLKELSELVQKIGQTDYYCKTFKVGGVVTIQTKDGIPVGMVNLDEAEIVFRLP